MRYVLLFLLIQLVSLLLTIVGIPVCALLAIEPSVLPPDSKGLYHWFLPIFWLWDNEEDGVAPTWYRVANPTWSHWRLVFTWTALRNSCNNLRFVPGVSKVGRPLYYRTFTIRGKLLYVKAGWMTNGYPALSAGAGKGY